MTLTIKLSSFLVLRFKFAIYGNILVITKCEWQIHPQTIWLFQCYFEQAITILSTYQLKNDMP